MLNYLCNKVCADNFFYILTGRLKFMTKLDLNALIKDILHEELSNQQLVESSLTAEEKVDAWHNGTRRENYKAAGVPKLNTFLEIAKRKGYDEIVKIIEAELAKRGSSTPAATTAKVSTTSTSLPTATSTATTPTEPVTDEAPVTTDEPAHFSDALVKDIDIDTEAAPVTLSDKEKEVLIGKAVETLGKPAFYVRSYWKTAMGFIGSYTHKWFNGNFNEVNANRASDKAADLTYDSSKLIVLRKDIDGGYHNVDRYYSIKVSSSTKYIVDRSNIRDNVRNYYQYYDSELDWRICTLTKTGANRKKFKQYLTDTAGVPEAQAEALTAEAFEGSAW